MTLEIGSIQGAIVASLIFGLVVTAVAAVVWIKTRRRTMIGAWAAVVTLMLYGLIWWWLWSGFYQITVNETTVELTSCFPTRTTTLLRSDITAARWVPGYKNTWVLVIETATGRHESARAGVTAEVRAAISAAIGRE